VVEHRRHAQPLAELRQQCLLQRKKAPPDRDDGEDLRPEVVLAQRAGKAHEGEAGAQPGEVDGIRTEVRLGQLPLLGRREAGLHDACDVALRRPGRSARMRSRSRPSP